MEAKVVATLPAADIERAKAWYADKLGLQPAEVMETGECWYEMGGTRFLLYQSQFAGTNQATAAGLIVEDFDAAMAELKDAGVAFEDYDFGEDLKTVDGVFTAPNGFKGAWFKDSEGNTLSIASM